MQTHKNNKRFAPTLENNDRKAPEIAHKFDIEKNKALARFQNRVKSELTSMLCMMINEQEAQEVSQEALLKIYFIASQNPLPHTFLQKLEALRPMLFKVAKNMALSRLRHIQVRERYYQAQKEDLLQTEITSIESLLVQETTTEALHKAINHLPPMCRTVFVERKVNGLSHTQISDKLKISKKTVENHISKGLKLCRQYILTIQQSGKFTCLNTDSDNKRHDGHHALSKQRNTP